MRLTINQTELSNHLEKVKALIPNRPTHSILGNFVLEATEGKLTISAFNLSLGVKTSVEAEVSETGTITVPAKLFSGLIASLPNQSLTLEINDKKDNSEDEKEGENNNILWIKSADSKYQIRYLSVDEYPDIPSVENSETISIKLKTFIELLNPVLPTYSDDETKQVLVGVHLTNKNNILELATTDGHRLSVTQALLEKEEENPADYKAMNLTIPGKALDYLYKNLKDLDPESNLKINWNDELVKFNFTSSEITIRLLQGEYPNYNSLVPPRFWVQLSFIGSDIIEAIKRLLLFTPDKNIIIIETNKNLQTLTLTTPSTNIGEGAETVHAEIDKNLKMGLNGKYIIEAIKALEAKSLTLNINTPTSPAVLMPTESTLNRSLVLVMPVQIKDSDMFVEETTTEEEVSTDKAQELIDNSIKDSEINNDDNSEPINENNLSSEMSVEIRDVPVTPKTIETQKLTKPIPDHPVEENQPTAKKKLEEKEICSCSLNQ